MPIPPQLLAIGGALAMLAGFIGGWTVRDWKRDSEVLAGMKKTAQQLEQATQRVNTAATAYEQEKPDAQARTSNRESTIREIYHDRVVPADCAAPDGAVRVLNDAIADANARAAGQPAPGLPAAAPGTGAADRR